MEMRRFEFRLTSVSLFHLLFPLYLDVTRLVEGWRSPCADAELVLKKKKRGRRRLCNQSWERQIDVPSCALSLLSLFLQVFFLTGENKNLHLGSVTVPPSPLFPLFFL